ncbi:MAG TPA: SsrA-binding protein SmpB [Candidatus Wallbacteria bacterium]|nr:MAG: SsrA-binding protein [bacterium ADurb.Bin243]HOD40699.1 SsrA-binding protein SmpB [Candidatus Wallbacteria bacterium]HPG59557.1 SsrA-binding protein SmpB [Candidatus Wallbacteria bacterium]
MEGIKIVATNRKAHFNYEVIESYEAGVVLMGTEIKSVRDGKISIGDSYCIARNGEVMMINSHIDEYTFGNRFNHEPKRTRKLLLHKKEILRLIGKTSERGFSIIPLKAYFKRGRLKVEIALCRGKKSFDKKETLKERDLKKQFQKEIKGNY